MNRHIHHRGTILKYFSSKEVNNKKIMISHMGWEDRLDPHQPYLSAFIFNSENRSQMCCKKMKIQGGRLAMFSAKIS